MQQEQDRTYAYDSAGAPCPTSELSRVPDERAQASEIRDPEATQSILAAYYIALRNSCAGSGLSSGTRIQAAYACVPRVEHNGFARVRLLRRHRAWDDRSPAHAEAPRRCPRDRRDARRRRRWGLRRALRASTAAVDARRAVHHHGAVACRRAGAIDPLGASDGNGDRKST